MITYQRRSSIGNPLAVIFWGLIASAGIVSGLDVSITAVESLIRMVF